MTAMCFPRAAASRSFALLIAILIGLTPLAAHAQLKHASGTVEQRFTPHSKKTEADEKRTLLAQLEEAAQKDAVSQALITVYGTKAKYGTRFDAILTEAYKRKAMFVRDTDVRAEGVLGDLAKVEIAITYDKVKLEEFLKDTFDISVTGDLLSKFSVYVLAYTVEGGDPNRTGPQLLQEEIDDNKANVQSSASASDIKNVQQASADVKDFRAASSASQSSIDASIKSRTSQTSNASGQETQSGSVRGSQSSLGATGTQKADISVKGQSTSSSSLNSSSSRELDGSVAASRAAGSASIQDQRVKASTFSDTSAQTTQRNFSDTSTSYHSLRVYADTTKKGAGQTNEIRSKLGELLKVYGFDIKNAAVNLQSREFQNEDELNQAILEELRRSPDFDAKDFVALALSRLTPVPETHGYTAQVQYRVSRIGDGRVLLAEQSASGDSGAQPSDDIARDTAVQIAMKRAEPVFAANLKNAISDFQKLESVRASQYELRITGLISPTATSPIQTALRTGGFEFKSTFRNGVQTFTIQLGGKETTQIEAILDPLLATYDFVSRDESRTDVKTK